MKPEEIACEIDMAALYDKTAEKWTRDEPKLRDDLISWSLLIPLLRHFGEGRTILDCGCGSGNICRMISPFAKNVVGIDISKRMIVEAEKHNSSPSKILYIEGDMMKLNDFLSPASIDLCLSIFGFCCIKNLDGLKQTFQQMRRVVNPDGAAIIQIPHPLDGFFKQASSWINDMELPKSYFDSGTPVRRKLKTTDEDWLMVARHHFTISDYVAAILSAGFCITQLLEPKPSAEELQKYPTLAREAMVPSSMIFVIVPDEISIKTNQNPAVTVPDKTNSTA